MTPRKRWPNEADWARLDSIARAKKIDQLARPIVEGEHMTDIERVQRAAQVCRLALLIEKDLQAVGTKSVKKTMPAAALSAE
jgi:hypothetical protein